MSSLTPAQPGPDDAHQGALAAVPLEMCLVEIAASTDPAANREALRSLDVPRADLVVLPEAFARDFGSPDEDLAPFAEPLDGRFVTALKAKAAEHGGVWVAGFMEQTEGLPFNTLVAVDGSSVLSVYRKIHLYDSFGYLESSRLQPGPPEAALFDVRGFRVGLQTCYDLRFPELARLQAARGADVMVVPAAWVSGEHKARHWTTLLRARSIENVCYVAGVGQPGPRYTGLSDLIDPLGRSVGIERSRSAPRSGKPAGRSGTRVVTGAVSHDELKTIRTHNPSLNNRRRDLPAL